MQSKSMDWFLYDRDFRHESVNKILLRIVERTTREQIKGNGTKKTKVRWQLSNYRAKMGKIIG